MTTGFGDGETLRQGSALREVRGSAQSRRGSVGRRAGMVQRGNYEAGDATPAVLDRHQETRRGIERGRQKFAAARRQLRGSRAGRRNPRWRNSRAESWACVGRGPSAGLLAGPASELGWAG